MFTKKELRQLHAVLNRHIYHAGTSTKREIVRLRNKIEAEIIEPEKDDEITRRIKYAAEKLRKECANIGYIKANRSWAEFAKNSHAMLLKMKNSTKGHNISADPGGHVINKSTCKCWNDE